MFLSLKCENLYVVYIFQMNVNVFFQRTFRFRSIGCRIRVGMWKKYVEHNVRRWISQSDLTIDTRFLNLTHSITKSELGLSIFAFNLICGLWQDNFVAFPLFRENSIELGKVSPSLIQKIITGRVSTLRNSNQFSNETRSYRSFQPPLGMTCRWPQLCRRPLGPPVLMYSPYYGPVCAHGIRVRDPTKAGPTLQIS